MDETEYTMCPHGQSRGGMPPSRPEMPTTEELGVRGDWSARFLERGHRCDRHDLSGIRHLTSPGRRATNTEHVRVLTVVAWLTNMPPFLTSCIV
ncbi:hypothetical protein ElyMa_001905400 [Elysia marginata]|uniref:Uncharacterized protein n=1 Tax=Elysia marginata TaxID=1093978 RepID=A0AAV4ETA9_9GAST|nr:hypothetical protein ElyMa_001905400 [Elysia marginata]